MYTMDILSIEYNQYELILFKVSIPNFTIQDRVVDFDL